MKKTLLLSCALALAGFASTAAAHGSAGFVRAEVGRTSIDIESEEIDKDTSAFFGGGYWFTPNVGIEGHLGTLYNRTIGIDTEFDIVSIGVGVVAKKNFGADGNGFFIGGRAGVARTTLQVREDDFDVIDDTHSTKPYFGVNVGYDFNDNFGVALNYDRRQADIDDAGENFDLDADTLSVSGEYRF